MYEWLTFVVMYETYSFTEPIISLTDEETAKRQLQELHDYLATNFTDQVMKKNNI